jgi:hypothetical protein
VSSVQGARSRERRAPRLEGIDRRGASWGWIVIVLGALQLLAAFAVVSGSSWAQWVGVGIASLNAIGQLTFLPAYRCRRSRFPRSTCSSSSRWWRTGEHALR